MLQSQLLDFIQQHQLINSEDKILLAVSGGKDSVLMATLFKQAGIDFSIAHCNFNLRRDESQRDAAFVHLLATTMEMPLHTKIFDTELYAKTHQVSIQMAARSLRYDWFEELSLQFGYTKIALAHHKNDAIETVLLNLTRGTGISGLHGILPKNGKLIRPLLFLNADEIEAAIETEAITYVEDSSNQTTKYARNKIRKLVIPALKEINPNLEHTFSKNIDRFIETELVLKEVVTGIRKKIFTYKDEICFIKIEDLKSLNPLKLLFYELLTPYNFSEGVIELITQDLDKPSGTSFYSSTHRLTFDREHVLISPIIIDANQSLLWHSTEKEIVFLNGKMRITIADTLPWQFNTNMAYVNYDHLIFPLILRNWEQGDQFMPFGMSGFKKVSDFFIDNKISIPEKERLPILLNGNSEILWLAGLRQDNRYKVTETTKKVAIFEWILNESK